MIFVGVDGCKIGWLAIILKEGNSYEIEDFPNVESLFKKHKNASLMLVDVPIGLPNRAHTKRQCDMEARKLLDRKRKSSIFPAPCRETLYAKSYDEACRINKRVLGKKITKQTWNIIPKIREVDELLLKNKSANLRIKEIHPEICFWGLAGRRSMKYGKKAKVNKGFKERLQVLRKVYEPTNNIIKEALAKYRRNQVAKDDIVDALSAAVTGLLGKRKLYFIPNPVRSLKDSMGLPMEMAYYIRRK